MATKKAAKKSPRKPVSRPAKKAVKSAKKNGKKDDLSLRGFSMTQRKAVKIVNPSIRKKGARYVVTGEDGKGGAVTAFVGKDRAAAAVGAGIASKLGRW